MGEEVLGNLWRRRRADSDNRVSPGARVQRFLNEVNCVNNLCFRPWPVSPQDRGSVRHLHLASCCARTTGACTLGWRGDGHFVAAVPVDRYTRERRFVPPRRRDESSPVVAPIVPPGGATHARRVRAAEAYLMERKKWILVF